MLAAVSRYGAGNVYWMQYLDTMLGTYVGCSM